MLEYRRVEYDVAKAQAKIRERDCRNRWRRGCRTGGKTVRENCKTCHCERSARQSRSLSLDGRGLG